MNINNKFLIKSLLKITLSLMALISFNSTYSKYVNYDEAEKIANQYMDVNLSYIPTSPVRSGITSNAIVYSAFTFPFVKSENKINFNDEDIAYYLATLQNLNAAIKTKVVGNVLDANLTRPNQFYDAADTALLQLLLILDVQAKSFDDNSAQYLKIIEDALKTNYNKTTGFFDKDKVVSFIDKKLGNKKTTNQLLEEITKRRVPVLAAVTTLADKGSKFATEYAQEPANIKTATTSEKQKIVEKIIQNIADLNKEYLAVRDLIDKSKTTDKEKERVQIYLSGIKEHIDTLSNLENFPWLKNIVANFDEINKDFSHEIYSLLNASEYPGFDKAIESIIKNIKIKEAAPVPAALDKYLKEFPNLMTNPNQRGNHQFTALHVAATNGDLEGAKELIKLGTDVNAIGVHDITPLMQAAYYDKDNIVKLLLENNADTTLKTSNTGQTALDVARAQNSKNTIALLEK